MWVEASTILSLVLTSFFPHRWKDSTLCKLLIMHTHRHFNGSIWLSYDQAFCEHAQICTQLGKLHPSGSPYPTTEWTLCLFATFLAGSLQHSSIKVFLSTVRSLSIKSVSQLLFFYNCLQLQQVVQGIKRTQGSSS